VTLAGFLLWSKKYSRIEQSHYFCETISIHDFNSVSFGLKSRSTDGKPILRGAVRQRACLRRGPTDSNSSIAYFDLSVFSVLWGICFSLTANPNGKKNMAFWPHI
jgi:hypothetical protein